MSRFFDDASSQYFEYGAAVRTSMPISMACWFNSDDAAPANQQTLICVCDSGTTNNYYWLLLTSNAIGKFIRAQTASSGAAAVSVSSSPYREGCWEHAAAVFASSTLRTSYLNGVASTPNTTSTSAPTGLDNTTIGRQHQSSPKDYMSGMIMDAGIWDVALTGADVAALADGERVENVRPDALIACWSLDGVLGDNEYSSSKSGNIIKMTSNGGVSYRKDSPPRLRLRPRTASLFLPDYAVPAAATGQPAVKRMGGVRFAHSLGRGVW